jgi:5-methyltetrahydrofolate--homocysteine methyltransferase
MLIIGERINTSRKSIAPAVVARDEAFIAEEARRQLEAGATYIDVNCGTLVEEEPKFLEWLVQTVQAATGDAPCSIDSPNPVALERALKVHHGQPIINSITAEKERFSAILPLVRDFKTRVIALTMNDEGMPESAEERCAIGSGLITELTKVGIPLEDIFLDPMVRPVSTGDHYGQIVFQTIGKMTQEYPGLHTVCGLSNISYGLPARKIVNHTFLVMAMLSGLDSAILDPTDKRLTSLVHASKLLLGKDEYAMNYITAFREGRLDI